MGRERSLAASLGGRLRPVSGIEEELVANHRGTNAAELCNEIVARCLTRPGRDPGAARAEVADLLVTDRDLALVELRQRSFGSELAMELSCPECSALHDVTIDLERLSAPAQTPREIAVEAEGRRVRVRLPTARDQALIEGAARRDLAAARASLLAATLLELDGLPGPFSMEQVLALDSRVRAAIDEAVEAALPDIDLALAATCSECGTAIEAPVHLAEVVLSELRERSRQLLREVHVLAREYHWSERQILSLSVERRRAYLALIEAERDAALFAGAADG